VKLLRLTMFLGLATHGTAAMAECTAKQQQYPAYITGHGEGTSYEEAKSAALVDAAGFFGVRLDSTAEVAEDGNGSDAVYLSGSIKTKVDKIVKGAEVLSQCQENATTTIIIGLKKTTIRALLDQQAEHRLTWISNNIAAKNMSAIRAAAKQLFEDEKTDLEAWILLQQPTTAFKAIPDPIKQKMLVLQPSTQRYQIKADGVIAEKSLSTVLNKLRERGIEVSTEVSGSILLTWACNIDQGAAMGSSIRFAAECSLSGADTGIEPMSVSGIASTGDMESTAARLISNKLKTIAH